MRSPKLLIFGAGAMGCTLAWHLAASGAAVTLAARGQALQAIQARGLSLWSEGQARASVAVQAVDAADLAWDFDFIIVCVKQYDLAAALQTLSPALRRGVPVVPLVNGVPWWFYGAHGGLETGPGLQHYAQVPMQGVIAGVVHIPARLRAAGVVEQGGRNSLVLGETRGPVSARVRQLAQLLDATELSCATSDQMLDMVWSKLLGNAVFNPLSVLAQASMREMLEDAYLRPMAQQMMAEVLAVGRALGLPQSTSVEQRMLQAASAGDVKTSMLQDALGGKKLELSAILGAVVHLAAQRGVRTPQLDAVWGVMRRRSDCF